MTIDMTETAPGQWAPPAEMQHRPRGAETLAELVAAGRMSGPRAFAIARGVREMARFRTEVDRAKAGDRTVSVAAQAVAYAEAGR